MKRFILIFGIILLANALALAQKDCTFKGIELKGDVEIVEFHADIDVYISEYSCSNCFTVEILPHTWKCGDWCIVEYHGKFSIRIVEYESSTTLSIFLKNMTKEEFLAKFAIQ